MEVREPQRKVGKELEQVGRTQRLVEFSGRDRVGLRLQCVRDRLRERAHAARRPRAASPVPPVEHAVELELRLLVHLLLRPIILFAIADLHITDGARTD